MIHFATSKSKTGLELPWKNFQRNIYRLQKRIYKASQNNDTATLLKLQKLMLTSYETRMLAIREVIQLCTFVGSAEPSKGDRATFPLCTCGATFPLRLCFSPKVKRGTFSLREKAEHPAGVLEAELFPFGKLFPYGEKLNTRRVFSKLNPYGFSPPLAKTRRVSALHGRCKGVLEQRRPSKRSFSTLLENPLHRPYKGVLDQDKFFGGRGIKTKRKLTNLELLELEKAFRLNIKNRTHESIPLGLLAESGQNFFNIVTFKNKVWKCIIKMIIEPAHEATFHEKSYGFRPGKSPHDVQKLLFLNLSRQANGKTKRVILFKIENLHQSNIQKLLKKILAPQSIKNKITKIF